MRIQAHYRLDRDLPTVFWHISADFHHFHHLFIIFSADFGSIMGQLEATTGLVNTGQKKKAGRVSTLAITTLN